MWSSSSCVPGWISSTWRRRCRPAWARGSSWTEPTHLSLTLSPQVRGDRILGALERNQHLDRKTHVAFDLELALHEGRGPVHLTKQDLHQVAGIRQDGQLRRIGRLTLAGFGRAVVDLDPPLAGLIAAQVERDGGVGAARLLRNEAGGNGLKQIVG